MSHLQLPPSHPAYNPHSSTRARLGTSSANITAPPVSSFRSSGVKIQMKKIPSVLFNKTIHSSPSSNKLRPVIDERTETKKADPPRPLLASLSPKRAFGVDKENNHASKAGKAKQGKARKGLAELFGWVNHSHTTQPSSVKPIKSISSPTSFVHTSSGSRAPAPPPKDGKMPHVLKKQPSRTLSGKSSQSALSGFRSLHVPQETPQTRSRPSMGEDPFSRRGEGATVVASVTRQPCGSSIRSSVTSQRAESRSTTRASLASTKGLSTKTLVDEETFIKSPETRSSTLTPPSTLSMSLASVSETVVAQPARGSMPVPSSILVDVPPRSASLGRVLAPAPVIHAASIDPSALKTPTPNRLSANSKEGSVQKEPSLKKEKTKSKVWGIFGKKKSVLPADGDRENRKEDRVLGDCQPVEDISLSATSGVGITAPRSRAEVALADRAPPNGTISSQSMPTSRDEGYFSVHSCSRPRPPVPVLHVQQPSTDSKRSTFSLHDYSRPLPSLPFVPASARSPNTAAPNKVHDPTIESIPKQPSVEGSSSNLVVALSHKGVPKRKSLSGVFGLAIRKSVDKIKSQTSRASLRSQESLSGTVRSPASCFKGKSLRSLAEELETADNVEARVGEPSVPYQSRFGSAALAQAYEPGVQKSQGDLRRVASATDKLSALVLIDFSPAPDTPSDNGSLAAPPSTTSLDASPTPIRRTRSVVLTSKQSASSPLKANASISPLKFALHRSQLVKGAKKQTSPSAKQARSFGSKLKAQYPTATSPPRTTSMVRRGMRNIFAPPTPPKHTVTSVTTTLSPSAAAKVVDEETRPGQMRNPPAKEPALQPREDSDVPADLKAIMGSMDLVEERRENTLRLMPSVTATSLGLPPLPPLDRRSPRRNNIFSPPKHSLPPVPDVPAAFATRSSTVSVSPVPPKLTLNLVDECDYRTSIFSDVLSITDGDDVKENRNSFDFTGEYAALDTGYQRASFVEALASAQLSVPLPSFAGLSPIPDDSDLSADCVSGMLSLRDISDDHDDADDDEVDEELEIEIATAVVHQTPRPSHIQSARTPRKSPFQGQAAFQAHAAQFKATTTESLEVEQPTQPFSFVSQPAAVDPPANTRQGRRRAHRMDEPGFSIASMSSVGSVIETGIAGDYTNYFEVNFANHLESQARLQSAGHSRDRSTDSMVSDQHGGRRHHRRNSSILSIDSINEDLAAIINGMSTGPPVSMFNTRRSGYVSRHRRAGSTDSVTFGRSDWAAHRRNASVESNASDVSPVRLGRPGLGDRMFHRDGGVQLTSITGSPAENHDPNGQVASPVPTPLPARIGHNQGHRREGSYDSFFEHAISTFTHDSIFDSSAQTMPDSLFDSSGTRTRDSIFDTTKVEEESVFNSTRTALNEKERKFMLKGLRPVSTVSTATPTTVEADERDIISSAKRGYVTCAYDMSPISKGPAACHEAEGEDDTMSRSLAESATSGRQVLNSSLVRPAKPRRRPARMDIPAGLASLAPQPETPALSSPSTSETSSRLSLETRFSSDAGSIFSSVGRFGHQRQKSSIQVQRQETIREEPSTATLRGLAASNRSRSRTVRVKGWDDDFEDADEEETPETIRYWNEWKREADAEYRRMKSYGVSSNSLRDNGEDRILTTADLMDFLTRSAEAYKPLDQLPIGRHIPHRRKSSLSESRQLLSPYGLPLPKPPTHGASLDMDGRPKKVSLLTKFERTQKSSTGSALTIDESQTPCPGTASPARPVSAVSSVFAPFARELPPSPPPKLASIPFSPFAFPFDTFKRSNSDSPALVKSSAAAAPSANGGSTERQRVNSNARRTALGWGRRRNSDGPTRVEQMARKYEENAKGMEGLPSDLREVVEKKVQVGGMPVSQSGKRSMPPMAISMTGEANVQARALRPVSLLSTLPSHVNGVAQLSLQSSQHNRDKAPEKRQATEPAATRPPREALTVRSNVAPAPTASRQDGKAGTAPFTVHQDAPKVAKVVRPKTSSRRTTANKPLAMSRQPFVPLRA